MFDSGAQHNEILPGIAAVFPYLERAFPKIALLYLHHRRQQELTFPLGRLSVPCTHCFCGNSIAWLVL